MKAKILICTLVLMFSAFAGSAAGNTIYGTGAGFSITSGFGNTFIGTNAGYWNTEGDQNTFIGHAAGSSGNYNTCLGYEAGYDITGDHNTFIGHSAGSGNSGTGNVFLGNKAGYGDHSDNKLIISNSDTPYPLIAGIFSSNVVAINNTLGIGTYVPARQLHLAGPNAVFRIDRTANSAAFIMVRTDESSNPMKTFVVGTNASGTNNGEFIINDLGTAVAGDGNRRMTIANDGTVTFTGNLFANNFNPSSIALKNNVRTYENALDTVNRLRGVSFDWKDSGKPSVGLIAEEVAQVVPEVVGYKDGAVTGVNYASLVGVLVEAVKEQQAIVKDQQVKHQAEIDCLKTEVQEKNSRLEQLEQRLLALEGK